MKWLFLAACVVLLGFVLRLSQLADQAIWWDEAWSITLSERPITEITPIIARDAHPPLYQWALHVWIRLTGMTEFAARYFSALVGTLTVAVSLVLARRLLHSTPWVLVAGVLVALSVVSIHWAQEARMYALGALWGTLVVYAYLRLNHKKRWWLLLLVASIAAPMSQYLAAFAVVVVNVHVLIQYRGGGGAAFWTRWLLVMGTAALVVGAWLLYALSLATRNPRVTDHDLIYPLQLWAATLVNGGSNHIEQFYVPSLVLALLVLFGFVLRLWKRQADTMLPLMLVILPPFFVWAINFVLVLPLSDRYYALYAPLALVGVVAALMAIWNWRIFSRIPLAVLGVGLTIVGLNALYQDRDARYLRDDYGSLIRAVDVLASDGERINFISGERYPLVDYYLRRLYYPNPTPYTVRGVPSGNDWLELMPTTTGNATSLWLIFIERFLGDRDGAREAWFRQNYRVATETAVDYNGFGLLVSPDSNNPFPTSDVILQPTVREVRPFDWVRVGVPANTPVRLLYGDVEIANMASDRWDLAQFQMFPAYSNGEYTLQVADQTFSVSLTHSQPAMMDNSTLGDYGELQLVRVNVPSRMIEARQVLPVTLTWRNPARSDRDVRVFVHLVGETWNNASNSFLWAQSDGLPVETPLAAWWGGLAAAETRLLQLPADLPQGTYRLVVGVYDAQTNERLTDTLTNSDYVEWLTLQSP